MTAVQSEKFVRRLRSVLARQDLAALSDADLWERYQRERNEAAFETLVRRHGPMVMGVCRRILRNDQDAEDAFQATFLVLVRRRTVLRSPTAIVNWLHGVARRTALEARTRAAKRRARESRVIPRTVTSGDLQAELGPVLDQELARLAEKYRAVVVLCDLEGKTRGEVARQLGWPEGTVASRLARGRGMLASRLARRGFPAVFVAALADGAASATVPAELSISTATAASSWATAGAVVEPVLTAKVVALTEGVLQSMLLSKIKSAIAALLLIAITALGAGGMISRTLATEPANPDDLQDRVQELKQQLQQMHNKVAKLEEEAQPRRDQRDGSLASLFKHRVPFETGLTESNEGGRIEISEVRGTRPRIEVGGQYLVRGKYVLPRGERGKLYFYLTAEGWSQPSATLDLQNAVVDKPEGEFTLVHAMAGPGYFHIYLAHPDRYSRTFANVYFGTGDNVLRKKP